MTNDPTSVFRGTSSSLMVMRPKGPGGTLSQLLKSHAHSHLHIWRAPFRTSPCSSSVNVLGALEGIWLLCFRGIQQQPVQGRAPPTWCSREEVEPCGQALRARATDTRAGCTTAAEHDLEQVDVPQVSPGCHKTS